MTAELQVLGFVNHAHATAADDLQHPVMGDFFPNQAGLALRRDPSATGSSGLFVVEVDGVPSSVRAVEDIDRPRLRISGYE